MAELLDVINSFSTPLKVGWVVWCAWGIGQVFWYRHERKPQLVPKRVVPPPSRRSAAVRTPAPVVQRFITQDPAPVQPVAAKPPVFDPSTAVVETFHAAGQELDSFVADFEKNTRQRRQLPHQSEHRGNSGDHAPQSM